MTPTAIPVLRSVLAAYAFFVAHWRPILIAGVPYTAAYTLYLVLMQAQTSGTADPRLGLIAGLLYVATMIASIALSAAALRMAVRGDFSGWLGLKLGRDEMRFLAAVVLVALLVIVVGVLVVVFGMVVTGTIALVTLESAGLPAEGGEFDVPAAFAYFGAVEWGAISFVVFACSGILVWLVARSCMAFPATVATESVQVMKVWPLSHKNGGRIALALLLAGLPITLIEIGLYEGLVHLMDERFIRVPETLLLDSPFMAFQDRFREYSLWLGLFSAINIPVFSGLYACIYQNRMKAQG